MNILIILGNKLLKGGKMDDILLNRLKKSIDIYEKKKYNFIIVSGGKVQKDSDYSESYIMKKFLLKNNIPTNIIIEEDKSIDTVSIAFGIRNVASIENALSEILRVLKHGGQFFCLEFSKCLKLPE